jgi:hypothetical protein
MSAMLRRPVFLAAAFLLAVIPSTVAPSTLAAQGTSSSSSSSATKENQAPTSNEDSIRARPRGRRPNDAGVPITLETQEAMFTIGAGLNACGYDTDLENSNPVRAEVRADVVAEVAASALARQKQAPLCDYIHLHQLSDRGREIAQYVSLGLYVSAPPELEPTAEQTDMPPDALQVVNILPLLRDWAQAVSLHAIWLKHRAEYDAIIDKVHDPVTQMILNTNIYLRVPVSTYDGRTFLILVEPLLAPSAPNARIYANDYALVTSPTAAGTIHLDQIRHLYLHFEIEPLVYAKAQSMERLRPLLKPVADAPIDFTYKSDVVALVAECLIKAIEARTMDVGFPPPVKPKNTRDREAELHYTEEMNAYQRGAEVVRRRQAALDMRQGWVLTDYFFEQMQAFEHAGESLGETMGQMVYGMDVTRVGDQAKKIDFLPESTGDLVRRSRPAPTGIALAEKKMMEGDLRGADALADKALQDSSQDHAEAYYVKARVSLMQDDPAQSFEQFQEVLRTAKSPRTAAWAHIYLGRLYDIQTPAQRGKAVAEYKAALTVPGIQPDAQAAAELGLRKAFTVPKVVHEDPDDAPLDPSGKAEKESYVPDPPAAGTKKPVVPK